MALLDKATDFRRSATKPGRQIFGGLGWVGTGMAPPPPPSSRPKDYVGEMADLLHAGSFQAPFAQRLLWDLQGPRRL